MVALALRRSGCCTALAKADRWRRGGLARDRYALCKSHEMRGRSWSWAFGRAPSRNDAAIQGKSRGIDLADQARLQTPASLGPPLGQPAGHRKTPGPAP